MRGFRRVDPTKPSANPRTNGTKTHGEKSTPTNSNSKPSYDSATSGTAPLGSSPTPPGRADTNPNTNKKQYCHYFVNQGKCRHEERTGSKCKFEHSQAPMCNFGTGCSRTKCMYSHPKIPGGQNSHRFLGQMMNPWNIMNPWMNQNQTQNPWNIPQPWNMNMNMGNQSSNQ